MTKKNRKINKGTDGKASKGSKQLLSSRPDQRVKLRHYMIWSVSVLVIAIAIVSTWAIYKNLSQESSKATSINQSRAEAPVPSSGDASIAISGGPQISFPETEYDFGTITQGSKVSHTFVVRNTGDAPLRLIKAQGT
jgi:hypothetical protein